MSELSERANLHANLFSPQLVMPLKNTLLVSSMLASMVLAPFAVSGQTTVYEEKFSSDPTVAMNNNNSNVMGSTGTQAGQYVRSTTAGAQFEYNATDDLINVGGREGFNYGMALILDVSGWAADDYNLSFDVSDYVSGNAANFTTYSLWEGSGVNFSNAAGGSVRVDLTEASTTLGTPVFRGADNGAALTNTIASGVAFTSSVDVDFTLTEGGTTGDWLMIGWGTSRAAGVDETSFNLDNVAVATVPEPSSYALLASLCSLSCVMLRRRS